MKLRNADVVIVGAGPTGLMLAGELALAGIDVAILERRTDQTLTGMRAGGLHARSIEVLDQRGIADRFLAAGQVGQVAGFAWIKLDISDFPTRHPYGLALWQNEIERILTGWIEELGVPIHRGCEVADFTQHAGGVDIAVTDRGPIHARYLIGCDGGRSVVRKIAGINFTGSGPTISHLIGEVELSEEPAWGLRHDAMGIHSFAKMGEGEHVRVMVTEQSLEREREPNLADLSEALIAVYGTDYGARDPRWISRFTDMTRQAERYCSGRVLLAGDAAHVHYPAGGQGLNTGLQDAVNLGWKLAQVVKEASPESLLDSYHAERHPVAARVLQNTMAQVALLRRAEERLDALRAIVGELLSLGEPRKRIAAMTTGLDVQYDFGEGHPLVGRRMPDLNLKTDGGRTTVYALLHRGQGALINLGERGAFGVEVGVRVVDATSDGVWELPVIGPVDAPGAVLVRPDGHVAWAGDARCDAFTAAVERWFGTAQAAEPLQMHT